MSNVVLMSFIECSLKECSDVVPRIGNLRCRYHIWRAHSVGSGRLALGSSPRPFRRRWRCDTRRLGQLRLLGPVHQSKDHATGFDVDAPIIEVSWEDVGSGVLGLFTTALVLGLITERQEPASRVVGAASIAGLVALMLDIFV